ncbi:SOS response-associated peptidase [Shouchella clausii]|uniref:Abasic site processing protein n=1 Tax=Shouchella clausii TaxID=79880 RepID=A0A268P099_SHOCL|nr:SOS response-associated peptidase [Shouchella clausii]MDO7266435.1 SOS response-associated peptidase [Shouchella clausii]MDO7286650.1 SOS response-associated peptidase [Shouchella clausii]PAE89173.1 hypothetical protein CHH72_09100 [Shouchella clausii]PAE94216.1 hypothetical protein CHH70_09125 [Shouchella clausii]
MCGRFTLTASPTDVEEELGIEIPSFPPSHNIAPTEEILAIAAIHTAPKACFFHWGLIPHWSKQKNKGPKPINARAETIADTMPFKHLLPRKRCLIVADGFYEWTSDKTPFHFQNENGRLMTFAGLWDTWQDSESGEAVSSCTIITTRPNELVGKYHDRMPVILEEGNREAWLDVDITDASLLQKVLEPYDSDKMHACRISKAINNPTYKGPL